MSVSTINQFLGILTLASLTLMATIIICSLISKDAKRDILNFLSKRAIKLAFLIALASMVGSLFYSDIAGYSPCKLCWYQRIFMYPQVILLGLALYKKEKHIIGYSLALSLVGFIIAGYHYLMQIGWVPALNCAALGYSVSCAKEFVMQFGFITIPMMSLTAFSLMILLLITAKLKK